MNYTIDSPISYVSNAMSELSAFLKKQMKDNDWTWRVAEETTGVSKSALSNIIDNPDVIPGLETLMKLSRAFSLPLWKVIEMTGFDLGFQDNNKSIAERVASLLAASPELKPGLDRLLSAQPDEVEGMLRWLEIQQLMKQH